MTDENIDKTVETNDDSVEFVENEDFSGEASIKDKLKHLRTKLKEAESEKRENLAGWQRAKADLINSKKNLEADRPRLIALGKRQLIEDLLPVLDSFYSAMKNQANWQAVEPNWRTGVEYIHNQFVGALTENDLEIIEPNIGDLFDDEVHELSGSIENPESDLKISNVKRLGYRLGGILIRPAMVEVETEIA